MFNIGPQELLLVLIVALIIVGPKRLPELGRTIGGWLNEFRKIQDEVKDMVKFDLAADPVDVEDSVASTTEASSDPHDVDREHDFDDDDDDDENGDGGGLDATPGDDSDDGMTHSERVIAAMAEDEPDDESDVEPETELEATSGDKVDIAGVEPEPLAAVPDPDSEPEPASPPDAAPAAAAE